jgi:xylulose-5-phosphate/fructose-6-phosphate phosphoketolase
MTTTTIPVRREGAPAYAPEELALDLRFWAAANYLTAAQIYLRDNPLLREPLTPEHIKPRLLGHWGTSPGLTMIYTLLNRLIRRTGVQTLLVTGPVTADPRCWRAPISTAPTARCTRRSARTCPA